MKPPDDPSLPFFAYGLFKPDQLGFHRLRDLVISSAATLHPGELRIRDGLPILNPTGPGSVPGSLLFFSRSAEAYRRLAELEPDKQYVWSETTLSGARANVLIGLRPEDGSVPAEEEWDGSRDPLFTTALCVVRETLDANRGFQWDLRPLFRLEMAYSLLWSSIERFLSLKYHLGQDVWQKVKRLADEEAFQAGLRKLRPNRRSVHRTDDPQARQILASNPKRAVEYYYQVRSNLAHRGKGVVADHDLMLSALNELTVLFEAVLLSAFGDKWRAEYTKALGKSL